MIILKAEIITKTDALDNLELPILKYIFLGVNVRKDVFASCFACPEAGGCFLDR